MYSYCYVHVLLLLCIFCSVYSVSLCCSVYCLCATVYCTVLLPPGVNPTAVNKIYRISHTANDAGGNSENGWPTGGTSDTSQDTRHTHHTTFNRKVKWTDQFSNSGLLYGKCTLTTRSTARPKNGHADANNINKGKARLLGPLHNKWPWNSPRPLRSN